jgi:hypothetical protein
MLASSSQLLEALDVESVDSGTADFCLDHHRLDFEERSFYVGGDVPSPCVAALTHLLQELRQMLIVKADEEGRRRFV